MTEYDIDDIKKKLSKMRHLLEKQGEYVDEIGRLYLSLMKEHNNDRKEIEKLESYINLLDYKQQKN
tara:strand:- start:5830 stop:6027 length:198 start_codon:yes stop_codon:yes gene_type:complete